MIHFQISYIDPGSGSILLQMVIGGFLGTVYVGRKVVYQAVNSLKGMGGRRTDKTVGSAGEK